MIKYLYGATNGDQDAFALQHGQAYLVEFIPSILRNGRLIDTAFCSSPDEVKELKAAGGKPRGVIRACDFGW